MPSKIVCECGAVVADGDGEVCATLPACSACEPGADESVPSRAATPVTRPPPRAEVAPVLPVAPPGAISLHVARVGPTSCALVLMSNPTSVQFALPIDGAEQILIAALEQVRALKAERVVLAGSMPKVPMDPIAAARMRQQMGG